MRRSVAATLAGRRSLAVARVTRLGASMPFAPLAARLHTRAYRLTRGRAGGSWFGAPVLVLTVRGRTSGQPRSTPLVYARHAGGWVVAAANGGSSAIPQWWLNLQASGEATIDTDSGPTPVRPALLDEDAARSAWTALVAAYPPARHYPLLSGRQPPVALLRPFPTPTPR